LHFSAEFLTFKSVCVTADSILRMALTFAYGRGLIASCDDESNVENQVLGKRRDATNKKDARSNEEMVHEG